MATNVGTAYVPVRPDMTSFGKEVATGVNKAIPKQGGFLSKTFSGFGGQAAAGFLAGFGAVQVGKAIVGFLGDSISAASDLTESISKVNVVFGESADTIMAWSEDSATALGISQQAALEAAGTFGNLFDSLGIAAEAGSEMSTQLVQLASDLASFNNASPEDVLLALRSGLVGEVEPLRKFGVSLSAARIQQEALADGLVHGNETLSAAVKAQEAYKIILEDTGNAQGDFARTSDGLANQQRILSARFKDAQAAIGEELMPVLLDLIPVLTDLGERVLPLIVENVGDAAGVFSEMAKGAQDFFDLVGLGEGQKAITDLDQDIQNLTSDNGILGGAFTLMTLGFHDFTGVVDHSSEVTGKWAEQILSGELRLTQLQAALKGTEYEGTGLVTQTRELTYAMGRAAMAEGLAGDAVSELPPLFSKAGGGIRAFGNLGKAAIQELRGAARENIPAIGILFEDLNDDARITAAEVLKAFKDSAKASLQYVRDIKEIDKQSVPDAFKQYITVEHPELLRIYAGAPKKIQRELVANWRANTDAAVKAADAQDRLFNVGRRSAQSWIEGLASGANSYASLAATAFREAAAGAAQAADDALGIESPSRWGIRTGQAWMEGIIQGVEKMRTKLDSLVTGLIDKLKTKLGDKNKGLVAGITSDFQQLQKELTKTEAHFNRLAERALKFTDAIRSGFDMDIFSRANALFSRTDENGNPVTTTSADISATIAQQVAEQVHFAELLTGLAAKGLSKANLAQLAGQGASASALAEALLGDPALIAQMNEAQAAIAKAAGDAATALGDKFFGRALDRTERKLNNLSDAIESFVSMLQSLIAMSRQQTVAALSAGGGGGGGGGVMPSGGKPHGSNPWDTGWNQGGGGGGHGNKPNVTVNISGWVGNDQRVAEKVRNELIRVGRNNGGTGL